jgi:hypothetical protein
MGGGEASGIAGRKVPRRNRLRRCGAISRDQTASRFSTDSASCVSFWSAAFSWARLACSSLMTFFLPSWFAQAISVP